MTIFNLARRTVLLTAVLGLAACSSSDSGTGTAPTTGSNFGFAAVRSSDYASGRIERISLDDGNTINGSYPSTGSDIAVTTDGSNVYQIGRFTLNSVTRFDPIDTATPDFQLTVDSEDETGSANPQAIAFLNETKAYLTRRGSTNLWIIDPSVAQDGALQTGSIDLSAYAPEGALPYVTDAIIVGDKLFVLAERLLLLESGSQVPNDSAYLIVIDTTTDMEITTGQGEGDLAGIALNVKNPTALQYNAATGEVYVLGRGNYFESAAVTDDFHSGGIEVIDPDTYEHYVLLDDGTDEDNFGYFYDMHVVDSSVGYLLTYQAWQSTTLYTFNPMTGLRSLEHVGTLQGVDITSMVEGPDNHLWLGVSGEANGFLRIDLATGLVQDGIVDTGDLIPLGISFVNVPTDTAAQ